jgi:hypothetical protein
MNQIFGYQISGSHTPRVVPTFAGANPVDLPRPADSDPPQLKFYATPHCSLQVHYSEQSGSYTYLWGIPSHQTVTSSKIPEWCAEEVASKRYTSFRDLIGPFVLIVDEPKQKRIIFVTDPLGIRPIFIAKHSDGMLFGSDVWPIQRTGLVAPTINYDAVCCWIAYGFNCNSSSLFSNIHRLPPGAAVVFQNGCRREVPYAVFEPDNRSESPEKMTDDIHSMVTFAAKRLLSNHNQISVALSGGFDSRYLLAMASNILPFSSISCATVPVPPAESIIAHQVAQALGIPLRIAPGANSQLDLYDPVFHFTPDGFPISKQVTHCVAELYPNLPLLNGYLGGPLIQGSNDRYEGKLEPEWRGDVAGVVQQVLLMGASFDTFRPDMAQKILARARVPMEEAVKKGAETHKSLAYADLYYRQRFYFSNNFLQHLAYGEALLPFYTWDLIAYKVSHDYALFSQDTSVRIFQKYFPAIAHIPHASGLIRDSENGMARSTRRLAARLLPTLLNSKRLSLISRKRCLLLSLAATAGHPRAETTTLRLASLAMLEQRLIDAGVDFDWELI